MRKFDLSKIASLEELAASAPATGETLEVLEPVVVRDPAQDECEELESGVDELVETTSALEALAVVLENSMAKGGMTSSELQLAKRHADYLNNRIGLESVVISNESTVTRIAQTQLAIESIKDSVKKGVQALVEFLKRLWEAGVRWVTGMTAHARKLKARFQELKGKNIDYDKEVLSMSGNRGKLLCKGGKPNSSSVLDLEKFVHEFYNSQFSSKVVDFQVYASLMFRENVTFGDIINLVMKEFPIFISPTSDSHKTDDGLIRFTWQSPIDAFRIHVTIPDHNNIEAIAENRSFGQVGYRPELDVDTSTITGSLKDLGVTNADAVIDKLISKISEFEKKASQWERSIYLNQRNQTRILTMIDESNKPHLHAILAPIGRCVVEPMRSMANVAYQALYAYEELFRSAADVHEKAVN